MAVRTTLQQVAATAKVPPPQVQITTNPQHVSPQQLERLFSQCSHSVHRFPSPAARPVDLNRLQTALSHSHVIVSAFALPESGQGKRKEWVWRSEAWRRGELVGFGRAVSDCALTASIHDVMVLPTLQGMGIGRMIVNRILRVLTSRGIYDISALCSEEERLFFKACGFGNDILESTTMMYTRTVSSDEENQTVHRFGRKQLLVPPDKKPFINRCGCQSCDAERFCNLKFMEGGG